MANSIEIDNFHAPELDVYTRLTVAQLLNRFEPKKVCLIAESPKVIERALNAGCRPVTIFVEKSKSEGKILRFFISSYNLFLRFLMLEVAFLQFFPFLFSLHKKSRKQRKQERR